MSTNLTSIDITTLKPSDLFRIVEEVKTTKTPRILKRDSEPAAMLMPVATAIKPKNSEEKRKRIILLGLYLEARIRFWESRRFC